MQFSSIIFPNDPNRHDHVVSTDINLIDSFGEAAKKTYIQLSNLFTDSGHKRVTKKLTLAPYGLLTEEAPAYKDQLIDDWCHFVAGDPLPPTGEAFTYTRPPHQKILRSEAQGAYRTETNEVLRGLHRLSAYYLQQSTRIHFAALAARRQAPSYPDDQERLERNASLIKAAANNWLIFAKQLNETAKDLMNQTPT